MSLVERQTILAVNQTRNQLSSLQSDDKETIIHAGAALESVMVEIPENYSQVSEAITLCLHALQAIFQDEAEDFELMVKAVLGVLIASEQSLGAHPNPISELMLKQAKTGLQNELEKIASEETEGDEAANFIGKLESLDDVAASLILLDLSDKKGLEKVCEALKIISGEEKNTEKRKLIVKSARELSKIISGKTADSQEAFNLVSELIDKANNCEESGKPDQKIVSAVSEIAEQKTTPVEAKEISEVPESDERKTVEKEIIEHFERRSVAESNRNSRSRRKSQSNDE